MSLQLDEYRLLGRSGLRVSPLSLGTMTFGMEGWGTDDAEAERMVDHYVGSGGNFIDFRSIPDWLTPISRLTINRWALEGFFNLTFIGQTLQEVSLNIMVLFGMGVLFFGLSVLFFRRRFVG